MYHIQAHPKSDSQLSGYAFGPSLSTEIPSRITCDGVYKDNHQKIHHATVSFSKLFLRCDKAAADYEISLLSHAAYLDR